MNDSTKIYIDFLNRKAEQKDEVIKSLRRDNEVQSIVNKELKKKCKILKLLIITLFVMNSLIAIYHLI
jgi:uncharacterized membrane protein YvbJ